MLNFVEIQMKTLKVQERKLQVKKTNARSRAKKMEAKEKEVEAILLAEENPITMANLSLIDPKTRAWFKKKQMMI
jgi:ribosomal protein L24